METIRMCNMVSVIVSNLWGYIKTAKMWCNYSAVVSPNFMYMVKSFLLRCETDNLLSVRS